MKLKINPKLTPEGRRKRELIEDTGCKVVSWVIGGGTHLKFTVELPNSEQRLLVCSLSTGDARSEKNMVALVRRWVKSAASP